MRLSSAAKVDAFDDAYTWSTWTPTVTAAAGSFTTTTINSARYRQFGKRVDYFIDCSITNKGTAIGDMRFSTPPGLSVVVSNTGVGREINTTGRILHTMCIGGAIVTWLEDNTFPGENGYRVTIRGSYKVA